ncbi:NADP-dependent oxidoreductase [Curtobacterium sp. ME-Dv--P-122a]|uniref:NADP-dependent oxidoreductase n=1 Tax=Curtobacterium sp. ME-Dv--P-122a TaxID=3040286 RepID=UPI00254CD332|nr:NADP-dependent oxidoreductase [Curtobacterium sp. ME-Dv--P-122a]
MKLVGTTSFGGPEVLGLHEVPCPDPAADEVRIRVHGAAVNPTDLAFRAGFYRAVLQKRTPPFVPGMDAAGIIDAVGKSVVGWNTGDRVMAVVDAPLVSGAYAEFVVVPARSVTRCPERLSLHEAAAVPMNALTARLALDSLPELRHGTLAVTGAAGAAGGFTVQLAKHEGFTVIADARGEDVELVKSLGADYVVPRGDEFAAEVRALVPQGVDAVVDAAVQTSAVFPAIRDGGHFVPLRGWDEPIPRGIVAHPIMVSDYTQESEKLRQIAEHIDAGVLTARIADVVPAERAHDAHTRLGLGGVRGRIVLDFAALA